MALPAIAAILGGLLDFGSQAVNNIERKNAAFDERLYNSPKQQVMRLKEAGLNPYALAPQVANNNTGSFPAGEVDAGGTLQRASQIYSQQQQVEMARDVNETQVGILKEQLEGVRLDNQLKRQTIQGKTDLLNLKVHLSSLDAQIKSGLITKQEYENGRQRILTDWQYYLAGLPSDTFGDPVDSFVGEESPMVASNNVEYRTKEAHATVVEQEAFVKTIMRDSLVKQIKFSALKTEQDYLLLVQKVIREAEAADYESKSHMPWNNKSIGVHIFEGILANVGDVLKNNPDLSFGQVLLYSVCDYLGVPRPSGKKRGPFRRK